MICNSHLLADVQNVPAINKLVDSCYTFQCHTSDVRNVASLKNKTVQLRCLPLLAVQYPRLSYSMQIYKIFLIETSHRQYRYQPFFHTPFLLNQITIHTLSHKTPRTFLSCELFGVVVYLNRVASVFLIGKPPVNCFLSQLLYMVVC